MTRRADIRTAPGLTAPRSGLLVAARVSNVVDRTRWGAGLDWETEMKSLADGGAPFGARKLGCDTDALDFTDKEKAPGESADPFMIYALDWCSTLDSRFTAGRDWQGRATRLLEATQSRSVAAEFWSGAITQAETLVNAYLTDGGATDVGSATPWVPERALALLDGYAMDAMSNGQAMIHCAPAVLVMLAAASAIRREGNLWLTPNDNIVCADAGYSGIDENRSAVMYATTIPEVVLGPVDVTPLDQTAVLRFVNDVHVVAQRDAMILWDADICFGSCLLDLDACPCADEVPPVQ